MYYLYHIPGKKIGVTRNLNNRVTLMQGYKSNEYEVLASSDDINFISSKEIELQKSYGYKVDRQSYTSLNKLNTMKINITEQTTTFPVPRAQLADWLIENKELTWETDHGEFNITEESSRAWVLANAKKSMYNDQRTFIYNKAYAENVLNNPQVEIDFNTIREWADKRGIVKEGNVNTQYIKLMEEAGELAQALLKDNKEEIKDAIGDMVVVLTNLSSLSKLKIEDCINHAYDQIAERTGEMINGTFVKDTL
tara:strand:+ start:1362 stop:2117 length:756 start_codon:yes stop_codon:yes gene_type:complete